MERQGGRILSLAAVTSSRNDVVSRQLSVMSCTAAQNASLAGGVAIGSAANLDMTPAGALPPPQTPVTSSL